jgi:hypothetical protein
MRISRRCLIPISCLLSTISLSSFALDFRQQVQVNGNTASGSLQVARNTYDQTQFIGCRVFVNEFQTSITCQATPVGGGGFACNIIQPDKKFLRAVYSISDTSYIKFTQNINGQCTDILVKNGGITY